MEVKNSLPDQAAASIVAEAAALDAKIAGQVPGSPGEPGAAPGAPAPLALDRELAGMAAMIGQVLGQFFPTVPKVLDDAKAEAIGGALAPVFVKYGLDRYVAGMAWRAELNALLVVVPTVLAVKAAIEHDISQANGGAAPAAPGAAPGAASSSSSSPAAGPMLRAIETVDHHPV